MGTQHVHRGVVKKNTSTEDMCNKDTCSKYRGKTQSTESLVNQWPPAQTCTTAVKWNTCRMHVGTQNPRTVVHNY